MDNPTSTPASDAPAPTAPVSPAPAPTAPVPPALADSFGRRVSYLRLSVTDRCDFRCIYCMAEHMTFLPRRDVLTLEELEQVCLAALALGVRKVRLTGGEPLVRRGIMGLVRALGRRLEAGELDELTMTTNASQLSRYAVELRDCGIRRINISLDTLDSKRFFSITRRENLDAVLRGVDAAQEAGLAVKINTVALRGVNEEELPALIAWAHGRDMDCTLIETMPMGEVETERMDLYLPLTRVRAALAARWTLLPLSDRTGGPARYVRVAQTGGRLGFITPMTGNFCADCNRIRITCTGTLHTCLGREDAVCLRGPLRADHSGGLVRDALVAAVARKAPGHEFVMDRPARPPAVRRHMSVTGG